MSGQSATYFMRRGIVAKQLRSSICENIMDHCLSKHSYREENWERDNMAEIIIDLCKAAVSRSDTKKLRTDEEFDY